MPSWPNQYHHVTGSGILAKLNWFEDTESHWECLILKPESMWYLSMSLFVAFPLNGCSVKLSCSPPHLVWTAGHTPHYFVLTTFARASKTTLLQLVLRYLLGYLLRYLLRYLLVLSFVSMWCLIRCNMLRLVQNKRSGPKSFWLTSAHAKGREVGQRAADG